jgi:hypothetical protein
VADLDPTDDIEIREFEFDARNLSHFSHGLTDIVIWDVWAGDFGVFVNPPQPTRSGTHLMIGPDSTGRLWTIVVVEVDQEAGRWRPITGWPSTAKETEAWREES